ncbi:hypothetical protein V1478_001571 [Vespula squamosa]|uniref:Uncharacterized protein n=1 Tax=Vespula squamosa TaxID=30214 RepID=A0ABD2C1V9_VESSQ
MYFNKFLAKSEGSLRQQRNVVRYHKSKKAVRPITLATNRDVTEVGLLNGIESMFVLKLYKFKFDFNPGSD